jgi:hypothetical protein
MASSHDASQGPQSSSSIQSTQSDTTQENTTQGIAQDDATPGNAVQEDDTQERDDYSNPWKEVIPPWLHAEWIDTNDQTGWRAETGFKITDPLVDIVRPALRYDDPDKGPSEYALRFGIFPGREDGRSCVSPPPETSWPCHFAGHDPDSFVSGQDNLDFLTGIVGSRACQKYLNTRGQGPAEAGGENDACKRLLQIYDQIKIEEGWQGIIFGDITTNEVSSKICAYHLSC